MNNDEMQAMADQCLEMMRTMGGMMGMHTEPGAIHDAGGMGGMGMGGMGMGGMGSMMGMAGGLGLLAIFLLLVGSAVLLGVVLTRRRSSHDMAGRGAPIDELDRRYARGEVERDSYLQIRRDLQEA